MPVTRIVAAAALLAAVSACTQEQAADGGGAAAPDDACRAAEFASLVGTSVGSLDAASLPEPRRVIFPGQPVTMDFRAERLNVEIGPDDRVARVFCG